MKRVLSFVILMIFLASLGTSAQAQEESKSFDVFLFYGQGCAHCAKISSFLNGIKKDYPNMNIIEKEVYFNNENRELFEKISSLFNTEIKGVPTVFIDSKVFVGFNNAIKDSLSLEILECSKKGCESPTIRINEESLEIIGESSPSEDPSKSEAIKKLTIPVVISAAAVDAINPCAFAVLIILMSTILASGIRKKALLAGIAFTTSIYISYFLMGIGLYSAVQASGITHIFFWTVAILAILLGLFNLKDYFAYGKWFVMEVPLSWRPRLKSLIQSVTSVPGAFLVGFVVSLFLLPCTSGPYIVILGLLAKSATKSYAIALLLLYNLIFILPMILITLAVYFGFTSAKKAEKWRTSKLKVLHLIAGTIILLLGIAMIIAILTGYL